MNRTFDPANVPEDKLYPAAPNFDESTRDSANTVLVLSRRKTAVSLIICAVTGPALGIVGVLVFLVFPIMGGFIVGIAGLCLLAIPFILFSLFDRSPKLVLCEQGIINNTEGEKQFLGWLRMREIRLVVKKNAPFPANNTLALTLVGRNGMESRKDISVDGLNQPPEMVLSMVQERAGNSQKKFLLRS